MTKLKHPGYAIGSFGLHLNLYSGPVYLLIFTVIVSLVLLVLCFDGKMRLTKTIHPIENEVGEGKKPKSNLLEFIRLNSWNFSRNWSINSSKRSTFRYNCRSCLLLHSFFDDYFYGIRAFSFNALHASRFSLDSSAGYFGFFNHASFYWSDRCCLVFNLHKWIFEG